MEGAWRLAGGLTSVTIGNREAHPRIRSSPQSSTSRYYAISAIAVLTTPEAFCPVPLCGVTEDGRLHHKVHILSESWRDLSIELETLDFGPASPHPNLGVLARTETTDQYATGCRMHSLGKTGRAVPVDGILLLIKMRCGALGVLVCRVD